MNPNGHAAIVTGAGSGLGAETAAALARAGAKVALLDINIDAARQHADKIGGLAIRCDVTSSDDAVAAIKRGACDFVSKPFQIDELLLALDSALEQRRLRSENAYLRAQLEQRYGVGGILGKSRPMQALFQLLDTAGTEAGEETLAGWLKFPAAPGEVPSLNVPALSAASTCRRASRWRSIADWHLVPARHGGAAIRTGFRGAQLRSRFVAAPDCKPRRSRHAAQDTSALPRL